MSTIVFIIWFYVLCSFIAHQNASDIAAEIKKHIVYKLTKKPWASQLSPATEHCDWSF